MSAYKSFTDLDVWQRARDFKKEIKALAKTFPPEEKFCLADQIIRSARSVNANIAEGHGRFGYPDRIKFCMNACGSLNETLNHLIDAFDCHYITKEQLFVFKEKFNEVMALLNGYINYIRRLQKEKT
jgi:four helix bundle protein